jgi:hypothetical protein
MSRFPRGATLRRSLSGLVFTAVVIAMPASALAAGSRPHAAPAKTAAVGVKFGYVWADQPTNPSYTPSTFYQKNSQGRTNTITRQGVGQYTVNFPALAGTNGGTVNVTAYGSGTSYCGVVSWGGSPDVSVSVRCADTNGSLVDSYFDATYTEKTKLAGKFGYVWADQPTSASYTPSTFYQYNSKGLTNTITRNGTGSYVVKFPGLWRATNGGTVKVTTYGPVSTRCKVTSWGPSGADVFVGVLCVNSFGTPVDSYYTMTYANKINLLGSGSPYGYAWADQPGSASYTPSTFYSASKPVGTIGITRSGTGTYTVAFNGVGTGLKSDVQVTAYGGTTNECRTTGWGPNATGQSIGVSCYDTNGSLVDTYYTIQFIR